MLLWSLLPAFADPSGSSVQSAEPSVEPPVLVEQVSLDYPDEAVMEGLHGDVSVLVDVDAEGGVTDARIESGPVVFHAVALDAARRLRFQPATRDGAPVAVTTRVGFHFAPPEIDDEAIEVVVHADDPDLEDTRARTTLDEVTLDRSAGSDLAETVAQVAGVQLASGTADASKPIIRGHQERRLLVIDDGVRHASQKWGPDHATEIDPFSAGSISVIRGAAGARYGPDAIGGVILVQPPPLRVEKGVGGKALLGFASNGMRPYGAVRLDVTPVRGLSARIEGNLARGARLSTPDYVLGNTASSTWNLGGTLGYTWDRGQIRVGWHHHDFRAGIFYGVRNSTPAELEAGFSADRPVNADLWKTSYRIDRAYQDVSHDRGTVHATFTGSAGTFEALYSFQLNRRREYEQVRTSITGPQYDFTLRTHGVDLLWSHPELLLPFGTLKGGLGLQGGFQENVYTGLGLIPNHRSLDGGVFAFERLSLRRVDLEVGVRLDGMQRTAFLGTEDYGEHVARGTLDGDRCTPVGTGARCASAYHAGSVSLGGLVHVVPETLDLKLDLSSASRFPNIDELYLQGSAPSFPVYALGYPDLRTETAWNASATAGLRLPWLTGELSGYAGIVERYIYFAPERTASGEPAYEVTIRGAWPRYTYSPIPAALYGFDGSVAIAEQAPLGMEARAAVVRAVDRRDGSQLVGTPADRFALTLVGRVPPLGPLRTSELRLTTEVVGAQTRVDPSQDFAPAPSGYALLGASLDTELRGRVPLRLGIEVHNALNARYRSYTSLLRYYADQPGRDVRVRIGASF